MLIYSNIFVSRKLIIWERSGNVEDFHRKLT